MTPSNPYSAIFHYRWAVRILAGLHRHRGARFVVLKHALKISADSLSRELARLVDLGLVQKNPGYGHPLRPEYILTPVGAAVAPACDDFAYTVLDLRVGQAVYRKWSVPLLRTLHGNPATFTTLRTHLAITPRALTQGLDRLGSADLIRQDGRYLATRTGEIVGGAANQIVAEFPAWTPTSP